MELHAFGIPAQLDLAVFFRDRRRQTEECCAHAVKMGHELVSLDDHQQVLLFETPALLLRREGERICGFSQRELATLLRDGRYSTAFVNDDTKRYVLRCDWPGIEGIFAWFIGAGFACLADTGEVQPGESHRWHFYPFHPGHRLVMLVKSGGLLQPE